MNNILLHEDYEYLEDVLKDLRNQAVKASKRLADAASHGGSFVMRIPEYDSICNLLEKLERQIEAINELLRNTKVISFEEIEQDSVNIYSLVETDDRNENLKQKLYVIYPELMDLLLIDGEVTPISPQSPIGRAILNKKQGEKIEIELPQKTRDLELISINKKRYSKKPLPS